MHATVPFSWPQLRGVTHLQVEMHSPGDCVPLGSSAHWPVAALQLYTTSGDGDGVGAGVGHGLHRRAPHGGEGAGTGPMQPVSGCGSFAQVTKVTLLSAGHGPVLPGSHAE